MVGAEKSWKMMPIDRTILRAKQHPRTKANGTLINTKYQRVVEFIAIDTAC